MHLSTHIADEPVAVNGDAIRLTQVFTNLLGNAIKYSPVGSKIALSLVVQDDDVLVTIADDGIGIPEDRLEHVFEMFAQLGQRGGSTEGGLGIGLTLVRTLVEMHGGQVKAESAGSGQGSQFVVQLPRVDSDVHATAKPTTGPVLPSLKGLRVMVVDDNREVVDSFADWLEAHGAIVRVCYDGPSAFGSAGFWQPHVVLLDLGLPGMDGWEVARRLRADPDGLPRLLVAVSGWGQVADVERSRRAGFDDHFTKPPQLSRLHALLEEHHAKVF